MAPFRPLMLRSLSPRWAPAVPCPPMRSTTVSRTAPAIVASMLVATALTAAEPPAAEPLADLLSAFPQSEQRRRQLKNYLARFPEADTNRDGSLSPVEQMVHRARQTRDRELAAIADRVQFTPDIEYLQVNGESLKLDLYLPRSNVKPLVEREPQSRRQASSLKPPLIIWYHGGGWMAGTKDICRVIWLAGEGYAVASVQYRLAPRTHVPILVDDCRAAILWLRSHAAEYGYDADRIGVAGESAGGHLASLLGTTGDGDTRVQAVLNIYGPGDMFAWLEGYNPQLATLLFGDNLEASRSRAEQVSPIRFVSGDDPPLLIVHGALDAGVPIELSRQLKAAYDRAGVPAELHVIEDAAHGGPKFTDPERRQLIQAFFERHLRLGPK